MICFFFISFFSQAQGINDWENPEIFQRNQVTPHTNLMPFNSMKEAMSLDKKSSPNYLNLNGLWKFRFSENLAQAPEDFYKNNYKHKGWDEIRVPSNWEMEGFGYPMFRNIGQPYNTQPPNVPKDFNPVGSYYRTFNLPEKWKGKQYFLHFEGVQSASTVWVNGEKVGYNQGAMEPAEYDITPYVKEGKNSIAVQVLHYSDGSYLEDQDTWRLAGIFRDVYVMATPKNHIHDYYVTTDLDSAYKDAVLHIEALMVNFDEPAREDFSIRISLFDTGGKQILSGMLNQDGETDADNNSQKYQGAFQVKDPKKWSAEYPFLYTLTLELLDQNKQVIEVFSHKTGFREVEVKDQAIYVNGVPIKFNAVNSHVMHPRTGHAMDVETMRKDLLLMKQFNINCVRTSHYPPNVEYLDLADELGMYIFDEAGDEAHSHIQLSSQPEWKHQYLDRMRKMVYRDRNHASVVVWSAGNESGPGENICAIIEEGKRLDPSRPAWMYGGNRDEDPQTNPIKCEDIVGPRYLRPFMLKQRFGMSKDPRPSFMDEYLSAAGNSVGALDEYWELIYKYPRLTGGAVWDWVSPGIEVAWRTTKDASKNNIAAALMNKALLKPGKYGNALYLSGHDDWLEVYRDPALDISGEALSLSFWVKPEAYNGDCYFLTKGNYQYGIWQPHEEKIEFYVHTGQRVAVDAQLPKDWKYNWHQVTGIYNGEELRLFIDGQEVASKSCAGAIVNGPYPVNIGKSAEIVDSHLGYLTHTTIDNVRIFDQAISVDKMMSNDEGLQSAAALWLDFEHISSNTDYYSIGLPGRTYGLVWPDRSVQPELWQLKKSPQPVAVKLIDLASGTIEVFNRYHFTDLHELEAKWVLKEDGRSLQSGVLKTDVAPLQKKTFTIPYDLENLTFGKHVVIEISWTLTSATDWADKGHEVAWEQFELPHEKIGQASAKTENIAKASESSSLGIAKSAENIIISGKNFTYTFDKNSGVLSSLVFKEKEFIKHGPKFNIWRAPLANELDAWGTYGTSIGEQADGMGKFIANGWYALGLDQLTEEVESIEIGNDPKNLWLEITTNATCNNKVTGFHVRYRYSFAESGEITLKTKVSPEGKFTHWLPKVGLQLRLPESFHKIRWYGRGPFETYPDRKTGAKFGVYESTVDQDYVPYIIPQDYGNKTDVYWTSISDDQGYGLLVTGDTSFNTSTQRFSTDNLTRAHYVPQLLKGDDVTLNLDHKVSGVGGTAISILNKYRVLPQEYEFTFYIQPYQE